MQPNYSQDQQPDLDLSDPDLIPRPAPSPIPLPPPTDDTSATPSPSSSSSEDQSTADGIPSPQKPKRKKGMRNMDKPFPEDIILRKNLTPKQRLFVIEYTKDGNGKRAAMATGTKEKYASSVAGRYLDPNGDFAHVAKAAREAFEEKRAETKIDAARIVEELGRVAFFNPKRLLDDEGMLTNLKEMPDEVAVSIKKIRVTYRVGVDSNGEPAKVKMTELEFWNKLDALKQLAQHLGLLKESHSTVNVLTLDWAGLMGRRLLPLPSSDPVEARIAAAEQGLNLLEAVKESKHQPSSVAVGGDTLNLPEDAPDSKPKNFEVENDPPRGLE